MLWLETMMSHLHGHDQAAGHVPHLVHHTVRSSTELTDLLQVIGFHLEILLQTRQRDKRSKCSNSASAEAFLWFAGPLYTLWHLNIVFFLFLLDCGETGLTTFTGGYRTLEMSCPQTSSIIKCKCDPTTFAAFLSQELWPDGHVPLCPALQPSVWTA